MHWENLEPLLASGPVILLALAIAVAAILWVAWRVSRPRRHQEQRVRQYWLRELQWRARIRSLALLNRIRTPRLTDQRKQRE